MDTFRHTRERLAAPLQVSAPSPGPGRKVVVIEDNEEAGQSLTDLLELAGHQVWLARDGWGGLALVEAIRPEVVLCDLGLPGIDGYEVARAIRRDTTLEDVRLVALTGYALPQDRQRALAAGFAAHVAKPIEFDELMAEVSKGATTALR